MKFKTNSNKGQNDKERRTSGTLVSESTKRMISPSLQLLPLAAQGLDLCPLSCSTSSIAISIAISSKSSSTPVVSASTSSATSSASDAPLLRYCIPYRLSGAWPCEYLFQ